MAYVNTPAFYTGYQSRSADEQPLAIDGDLGDVLDVEIPHAGGVKQFVVRRNQQRMLGMQDLGDLGFGIKSVTRAVTQAVKQVAAPVVKVAAPVIDVAKKALTVTTMGLPLAVGKVLPKALAIVAGKPKVAADAGGSIQYTDANGTPITKAQYDGLMAQYNQQSAATTPAVPGAPTSSIAATGATMTPLGPTLAPTQNMTPMASSGGMPSGYGSPYGGGGQSYSDMVTSSDAYDPSQMDQGFDVATSDESPADDDATASDSDSDEGLPMSGLSGPHGGHGHGGHHGGFGRRGRGGFALPYYYADTEDFWPVDPTVIILDERDDDDDEPQKSGIGALDTGASLVALGAVAFAIYLMVKAQPKRRRTAR